VQLLWVALWALAMPALEAAHAIDAQIAIPVTRPSFLARE
jgi:hypothetical protein